MALYLNTLYFLTDDSKHQLNEGSTQSDFDSYLTLGSYGDACIHIASRHGWSAIVVSELIKMSDSANVLPFLTDTPDSDNPFKLMPFSQHEKSISVIEELILWSKNNADKVCEFIGGAFDPQDILNAISSALISTAASSSWPWYRDDCDHPDFLYAYLVLVLKMLRYAHSKQISIIYLSWW
jgi:hypothetical protein